MKQSKLQKQTQDQALATEMMELVAAGETGKVASRLRSLSLPEFVEVMRRLRELEDVMTDIADERGGQWELAYAWGRGRPWPDEALRAAA